LPLPRFYFKLTRKHYDPLFKNERVSRCAGSNDVLLRLSLLAEAFQKAVMSDYYFTSDPHFGHERVIEYSSRPFSSVEEMDETLIDNWNKLVKPDDIIYELGDFAFLKLQPLKVLLHHLNGHKQAILGNHDKVIRKNKAELLRDGLFESIEDYVELNFKSQRICVFHYPMRSWRGAHHNPGAIALHGHTHNSIQPLGKSVDVGVDAKFIIPGTDVSIMGKKKEDYRPLHLEEILAWAAKQEFVQTDGHKPREEQ
jgi:calcineurin-like phosphoesterase family protein